MTRQEYDKAKILLKTNKNLLDLMDVIGKEIDEYDLQLDWKSNMFDIPAREKIEWDDWQNLKERLFSEIEKSRTMVTKEFDEI